jgi:hypothetical protein
VVRFQATTCCTAYLCFLDYCTEAWTVFYSRTLHQYDMAIAGGADEPSSVVEAKGEDNNDLTLEDHAALGSSE